MRVRDTTPLGGEEGRTGRIPPDGAKDDEGQEREQEGAQREPHVDVDRVRELCHHAEPLVAPQRRLRVGQGAVVQGGGLDVADIVWPQMHVLQSEEGQQPAQDVRPVRREDEHREWNLKGYALRKYCDPGMRDNHCGGI